MRTVPAAATLGRMNRIRRGTIVVVAVAAATSLGIAPARAGDPPCRQFLPAYTGESPRVDELVVEGHRVIVLKPDSYEASNRRYPVLYLLHGGMSTPDEWLVRMDLESLTAGLDAVVVMPTGGSGGFYSDWRHDPGRFNQWESFHIQRLVPFIDATYRTLAQRSQRAVAGLSMGGFGAMRYAARHPDLFVAAGSFSGLLDTNSTGTLRLLEHAAPALSPCFEGRVENLDDRWGPRATDEVWWRDSNPTDLAPNLAGVRIFTRVATGDPCDGDDLVDATESDITALTIEADAREQADNFRRALTAAGVGHDSATYDCGIHTYRYFERALREFLPWVLARYGSQPPAAFSYRSAAPRVTVWDWTFAASSRRAPEFLDVRSASGRGLTVSGTGTTRVTTGRSFAPCRPVAVTGARDEPQVLRAGADRRLRLGVDLGQPSRVQQYTAAHDLWGRPRVTREITFRPRKRLPLERRHGHRPRSRACPAEGAGRRAPA